MADEPRANYIAGAFGPALRGARFPDRGTPRESWPQSSGEDVGAAARAAEAGLIEWRALTPADRCELVCALARELERERGLVDALGARLGLRAEELAPHFAGLERDVAERLARVPGAASGVAWCAPDWRELLRAPLVDLTRELAAGRTAVLVSDARLPEACEHIALAAQAAGLPPGVLGVLHGPTRELLTLALDAPPRTERTLVASGLVERMVDLRRLCESRALADPRLRALRCGVHEVDPARALELVAGEVVERAFGRGPTFSGQLPGSLGRVFCPARAFSRFSELFLAALETSEAFRIPARHVEEEAGARVRAAWELGLDEGATCIAGGDADPAQSVIPPTVFTNVEAYMASARRQDPLPVLCLLRSA